MKDVVLDASVIVKWLRASDETRRAEALTLRKRFDDGELRVTAPTFLRLEILNVAARRWHWGPELLESLATELDSLGFEFREPTLVRVAHYAAQGLSAYDAAYVAVAEDAHALLVTDDARIVEVAPHIATALSACT